MRQPVNIFFSQINPRPPSPPSLLSDPQPNRLNFCQIATLPRLPNSSSGHSLDKPLNPFLNDLKTRRWIQTTRGVLAACHPHNKSPVQHLRSFPSALVREILSSCAPPIDPLSIGKNTSCSRKLAPVFCFAMNKFSWYVRRAATLFREDSQ